MSENYECGLYFDYPKKFPVEPISGIDVNNKDDVQILINEVLSEIKIEDGNLKRAGLILEGMLDEPLYDVINKDELKKFLTSHFQRRAETFNKILRGVEAT